MRFFAPLTLIYFVVLAVEIYAEVYGLRSWVYVTKPLLMPILILLFLANASKVLNKEKLFLTLALVFSLAGDVFLMFQLDELFVFGLASFLIGHLAYVLSFNGRIKEAALPLGTKLVLAIPFVGFVIGFLIFLFPYITANPETAPLFGPVAVYASVISLMGYTALLRKNAVSGTGFLYVFAGALLFIFSDSCIALNKFVAEFDAARFLIMATYGTAQYIITVGTLQSNKN